ncbi:MAG: PD-(D/E)XK nuclease family protein [Bacteroidales bacterium]|nr:PD-(D/E)XK nuclease family protein [Bacteroidales bacterium]
MDFLEKVAYKLREHHADELQRQIVVLPSRRAGLYLARSLSRLSDKPQWSPRMLTVSELFRSFTDLTPAENETLIFELYRVYKKRYGEEMSFDDFWSWGEVIINDFNDIDLYLADAGKLYGNINDLKEIDAKFGGLTEEQTEIIRGFWKSFNPGATASEARSKFQTIWQKLAPLYYDFRAVMLERHQAGDGMLCREVAELAINGALKVPEGMTWHIVGLNALNNCEKALFSYLKSLGQAKFYWDDAHFFMKDPDHKASVFMRENQRMFRNELDSGGSRDEVMPRGDWQIIDTPSDTAQARMVSQILEGNSVTDEGDLTGTAIILADEKLLMPVLTSLPQSVHDVNVTMGHPFRFTSLYSFLKQQLAMIRSARVTKAGTTFRSEEVITLLRHQYFRLLAGDGGEKVVSAIVSGNMIRVSEAMLTASLPLKRLFAVPAGGAEIPEHLTGVMEMIEAATFDAETEGMTLSTDREYLRIAMSCTVRLANLFRTYNLDLKTETCIRLLERVFRKLIVPFSGEPLKGIQIMGVLETRALDFKKIIFLSLNEGIFPGISYDNTYIPYNIRRAFGLPTLNEHESIYSYYFFRLLRKPSSGWFMYNSTSQGLTTGEMSRYLVRMSYSPLFSPQHRTVHISVGRSRMISSRIAKQTEHNRALLNLYGTGSEGKKYLSPSAVNTWVNCRMRFYYRYVCGMPEEETVEKDIDQRRFGNIMHDALQRIYEPLKGAAGAGASIGRMASDRGLLRNTIIEAASAEMKWDSETLMAGKGVIIIDVLERYLSELLSYDAMDTNLVLLHLEDDFSGIRTVSTAGGQTQVRIGGRADRVDMTGGAVRVVDYKTGTPRKEAVTPEDLFDEEKERRNDAFLQALLYCTLIRDSHHDSIVLPAIYWVQQLSLRDFTPYAPVAGLDGPGADRQEWARFMTAFSAGLDLTLNRIFSENEDYVMTRFERRCTYCPYRMLCRR